MSQQVSTLEEALAVERAARQRAEMLAALSLTLAATPSIEDALKTTLIPHFADSVTLDPISGDHYALTASQITVPLIAHDEPLGTIRFTVTQRDRAYTDVDLPLAEDIAQRVALAMHQANRYGKARRQARRRRNTVRHLRTITDSLPALIAYVDANEIYRFNSKGWEIWLGKPRSEITGRSVREVLGEARHAFLKPHIDAALSGQATGYVSPSQHSDGTFHTIDVQFVPDIYPDGSVRGFFALIIDVTDRTHAEEQAALYSDVVSNIQLALSIWQLDDPDDPASLRLIASNPASFVLSGLHPDDVIGKRIYEVFPHLRGSDRVEQYRQVILSGEPMDFGVIHHPAVNEKTLGRTYSLRGFALPGNRIGLVSDDITELEQARQNLTESLEREAAARHAAEQAVEDRMRFLAMVSHELRTPLASIKGFASTLLALDIEWDAENQREFLGVINDEADRLSELIEHVLDLSRLEAGTLRIDRKTETVESIVALAMPQLITIAEDHHLKLDLPPGLSPIVTDARRIAQVLVNLVNNACKYSPNGTRVTISAQPAGDTIEISVSDAGVGIPSHERAAIFDIFHQATNRPPTETRGVGLGLAISRGLIEAHGGKIWVADREGPGTTMTFSLPVA